MASNTSSEPTWKGAHSFGHTGETPNPSLQRQCSPFLRSWKWYCCNARRRAYLALLARARARGISSKLHQSCEFTFSSDRLPRDHPDVIRSNKMTCPTSSHQNSFTDSPENGPSSPRLMCRWILTASIGLLSEIIFWTCSSANHQSIDCQSKKIVPWTILISMAIVQGSKSPRALAIGRQ